MENIFTGLQGVVIRRQTISKYSENASVRPLEVSYTRLWNRTLIDTQVRILRELTC